MALQSQMVQCPHCWESFELVLDPAMIEQLDEGETSVSFVEDCFICCHPILFELVSEQDTLHVRVNEEE
jgi:hypothetical protein